MKTPITIVSLLFLPFLITAQVTEEDSLALVALYHATNGPEWTLDTNWLSDKPVDQWHGVDVDNGRVVGLQLYFNNLSGQLPDDIGDLTGLTFLYLWDNNIGGPLPESLGQLTQLQYFECSNNEFTGTIPASFANLDQLATVNLYKNQLSGSFPSVVFDMDALNRLSLGVNQFSGPIPPEINTLTQLEGLGLEENAFSGEMPSIKDLVNLADLYLHENQLTGDVANFLGHYPNMWYIKLDRNRFTGCMTPDFFSETNMQFIDFSECDISCLGDFSSMVANNVVRRINAFGNQLRFEDLETCLGVIQFFYSPQQALLNEESHLLEHGAMIEIESGSGGMYTQYQWFRNDTAMANETNATLVITDFSADDQGVYHCEMTNDSLPELTLYRNEVTLTLDGASAVRDLKILPLVVSPNPALDFVTIGSGQTFESVHIYDSMGRLVVEHSEPGTFGIIHVDRLSPGIYYVISKSNGTVSSGRFVKKGRG